MSADDRWYIEVVVEGEMACFTHPAHNAERLTYLIMTPTAAAGVLSAIFWKPEFHWHILEIDVLSPIETMSFTRNEVGHVPSLRTMKQEIKDTGTVEALDANKHRQQRITMVLQDVAYKIKACMVRAEHATDPIQKWASQWERRIERGQCYRRPYLGCKEFPASFRLPTEDDVPCKDVNLHVGPIVFRMTNRDAGANVIFVDATIEEGRMDLRNFQDLYEEVD